MRNDEYRALADLRFQVRRFLVFSEVQARAAGLEPQQHQLLLAVRGLPDDTAPTIGRLAERLLIRPHSAVELVDRLAKRRLVRRVRAGADGRQVHVHITAKGARLLRHLSRTHREELRHIAPELLTAVEALVGRSASARRRA